MRLGWTLSLVLMATAAGTARGQSPPELGTLRPGQVVRISTGRQHRFETRLGGSLGDSAGALFAQASVPVTVGEVDSLWVRGRATVTGAIVGGAVVTPVSFLFWAAVCDSVDEVGGCDEWGVVIGLSFASGAGGALLGAGVGALIPKWHLRYARDRDLSVSPLVTPGRLGLAVRF